jgi:hypothetical protein
MVKMINDEWQKQFGELEKLGAAITPEQQERLVRGKLLKNLLSGKDESTQSAKMLGSERRVGMFGADTQVGIILAMPKAPLPELKVHVLPEELEE